MKDSLAYGKKEKKIENESDDQWKVVERGRRMELVLQAAKRKQKDYKMALSRKREIGQGTYGGSRRNKTYELILIGGDSGEYGLREYEGLMRLPFQVLYRIPISGIRPLHQVNSWLIFVHRIQHQLKRQTILTSEYKSRFLKNILIKSLFGKI